MISKILEYRWLLSPTESLSHSLKLQKGIGLTCTSKKMRDIWSGFGMLGQGKKEMVAIKVICGIKKYREAAMIEIDVLQQLVKHDKNGT
ncbi:uncharacterized protein LOC131227519 isoform X4 [Magnolia sinica]|nr:uncharacterized protein LOC131227519 isoform X4 [Magnolia sinica]